MTDLFKLFLGILASRFKARATLEAENLDLRQQVNVLRLCLSEIKLARTDDEVRREMP
jgi:hypothetical protein